jgi:hypothetical protein
MSHSLHGGKISLLTEIPFPTIFEKILFRFLSRVPRFRKRREVAYTIFVLDFEAFRQKRCDVNFVAPFCRDVMCKFCVMYFAAICSF